MNNFLDKTGLEYLYNKLCKVFMLKGSKVRIDLMSEDIQNALGYTPISQELLDSSIESIRDDQKYFRDNFEELLSKVDEARVIVDSNTNTITSFAGRFNKNEQTINTVKSQLSANTASIENLAKSYDDNNKQLTTVINKLDAQNASINNIISRANSQGVAINSIRQLITDTLNSIKASVSIDDVEAAIEARVFDENGSLKSEITLDASQINIGTIGANIAFGGKLEAPSGTIGGWTVGNNVLSSYMSDYSEENSTNFSNYNVEINPNYGILFSSSSIGKPSSSRNLKIYPDGISIEHIMSGGFIGPKNTDKNIELSSSEGLKIWNHESGYYLDEDEPESYVPEKTVVSAHIKQDGSGNIANGNLSWNKSGNINNIVIGNDEVYTKITPTGIEFFNNATLSVKTITWNDLYNRIHTAD